MSLKKILAIGAGVVAGVAAYMTYLGSRHSAKYYAVEPMTQDRPARFEDMRWKSEGVEVRAPASIEK